MVQQDLLRVWGFLLRILSSGSSHVSLGFGDANISDLVIKLFE